MSILEELYYGNIRPTDKPQSEEVRRALADTAKTEELLMEILSDEQQKEKLSEISEHYSKLITLTERDSFIEGVRLGAKLMADLTSHTI